MTFTLRKTFFKLAAVLGLLMAGSVMAAANQTQTVGASGYDLVAYQTVSKALTGDSSHAAYHNGTTYLFASKANKEAFEADPVKYLPAYGGYCAMGVALGKKLPIDPKAFKVVDGTLYLNLNTKVQGMWFKDIPGNIEKANENWKDIQGVNPAAL